MRWSAIDQTLSRDVSVVTVTGPTLDATLDAARRVSVVTDARICQILDIGRHGDDDEVGYVVHEDLAGTTVQELIDMGPVTAEVARSVVGEMAHALDQASQAGLHHGCLTPANIIQTTTGDLRLLGTSIDAAAQGEDHDSPEAIARLDAVSLVHVLYSMLTGQKHTEDSPTAASLVSSVPADLDTLCSTTLGPHDDGPETPGDLLAQLRPWSRVPEDIAESSILNIDGEDSVDDDHNTDDSDDTPDVESNTDDEDSDTTDSHDDQTASNDEVPATSSDDEDDEKRDNSNERDSLPVIGKFLADGPSDTPLTDAQAPATTSGILSGGMGLDAFARKQPRPRPAAAFPAGSIDTTKPKKQRKAWGTSAASTYKPTAGATFEQIVGTHEHAVSPRTRRSSSAGIVALILFSIVLALALVVAVLVMNGSSQSREELERHLDTRPMRDSQPSTPAPETASQSVTEAPEGEKEVEAAGPAPQIANITAFDPLGDNNENNSELPKAVDGNPSTYWKSSRYKSAAFGGLKSGVGVIVSYDATWSPKKLTLGTRSGGGNVEIRTMSDKSLDSSKIVASGPITGTSTTFELKDVNKADKLLVWFTELPRGGGGYRAEVTSINVE